MKRFPLFVLLLGLSSALAAPPEPELSVGADGLYEIHWPEPTDGNHYVVKSTNDLATPIEDWETLPLLPSTLSGSQSVTTTYSPTSSDTPRQFFLLAPDAPTPSTLPTTPGRHLLAVPEHTDEETGETRSRLVYVFIPDSYVQPARDAEGRWPCPGGFPLAIILHGSGQTADDFQSNHPDLIAECNSRGVILIVPQGTPNSVTGKYGWNSAELNSRRNDLRFLVVLRALAGVLLYVDPDRVHVGGFSNGGLMSLVASHSLPRLFASSVAIGSSIRSEQVASSVISEVPTTLAPHPVLLVNAKNDSKRPFLGGLAANGLTTQASFLEGQTFLRNQHCSNPAMTPSTFNRPNGMLGGTIETWCPAPVDYTCPSDFEVQTVALEGGGHIWPDADDLTGYDANVEAIDFMLRHHIQPVSDYGNFTAIPETAGGNRNPLPATGIDIAVSIPPAPKALVFLLHGPGTNHDTFVDVTEMTAFTQGLLTDNIGWVSFSAASGGLWDLQNGPASNTDILNLLRVRQELINLGQINASTPIVPLGFDRGAHFALLAAHLLHSMNLPVGGCGMLCPDFSTPLPVAAKSAKENILVPIWTFAQENDQTANATLVWSYHETLRYRHEALREYSVMSLGREKCPSADRFDRILPAVDGDAIIQHLKGQGLLDTDGVRTFCKRDLGDTLADLSQNPPLNLGYTVNQLTEIFFQIQVMFASHHPEAGGSNTFPSYLGDMVDGPTPDGPPWIDLDIPPTTQIDVPPLGIGD